MGCIDGLGEQSVERFDIVIYHDKYQNIMILAEYRYRYHGRQ